jgi:hypothetical protein
MKAAIMVPGPQGGSWEVRDVQRPVVGPGQVLVRVHASSINRAEFRRLHTLRLEAGNCASRPASQRPRRAPAAATRRAKSSRSAQASPASRKATASWAAAPAGSPNSRWSTRVR